MCYYLYINKTKSKMLQSVYIPCVGIDLAKSVQICKHPIKFGHASSAGAAVPMLVRQVAVYITSRMDLYSLMYSIIHMYICKYVFMRASWKISYYMSLYICMC